MFIPKPLLLAGSLVAILASLALGTSFDPSAAQDTGRHFGDSGEKLPEAVSQQQPEQALPDHWFGPGPLHKLLITPDRLGDLEHLASRGALLRSVDYGGFQLAVVDEAAYGGREALSKLNFNFRDELDLMVFNGIVLDGRRPEKTLRALRPEERFTDPETLAIDPSSGLYIVQFEGPIRDEELQRVLDLGVGFSQYVPMNALVVELPAKGVLALENLARNEDFIQYAGAYEPAFRMHSTLREVAHAGQLNEALRVTIQLINARGVRSTLLDLASMADEILSVQSVGPYLNVRARLHPVFFSTLAASPTVFQLEPHGQIEALDERQGQIMAGNTNATGPSAPGYLAWLAGKGFNSSQFGSFSVNVVDDATSLSGHPDLPASRIAFTSNPTGQTGVQGGHGFLNAHIVAGFNNGTGSAFDDAGGYNYGLGIAPFARVGSTAIFGNGGLNPTAYESTAYASGARISTNSWGFSINNVPVADYDASAQEFDFITRDAQTATGNQEYLVVFSAGNGGSGSNTVGTPGTAKNVLTVGASENDRQTGSDGCGVPNSGANNFNDLASFSSQGPVNSSGGDGRWKPEIVAPGTHIEAGIPQSNYNGSSVCNQYWPLGQTLYGWSSGTSHSTPAVAGSAALVYQDFLNNGMSIPSPAMTKAYLVNSARYLSGVLTGGNLPSNAQGMGDADMSRTFDGLARVLVDQSVVLGSSGASHVVNGNVADSGQPFRVTLVWTDAPGPTSGAPFVNNLDLTVNVGGNTYRGNVFSGANSITGGSADIRNNTESVLLPARATGAFSVTVTGTSIGGDGVPGNGDSTDQDFALVVYNATTGAAGPVASFTGNPTSGNAPLTVNFTDSSSGSPTSWLWNFGDSTTSTQQHPSHIYNTPGTYSVSLDVTAASGSDSLTRTNYITVQAPPVPGISDGSFEAQTPGATPAAPWSNFFGSGHVINPAGGFSSDSGMPTNGANWLEVTGLSSNASTPPSNPGGFGSAPLNGAGIAQSFSYDTGSTLLSFSAAFMRNEAANSSFNDWMSVDISDGSSSYNLYYADTFTATPGTSAKSGLPITAISNVSVDLASVFTGSSSSTSFTLTIQIGNASDNVQPSLGYADNFALTGAGPAAPLANFSGTPLSGTLPLLVNFTDSSLNSITSWAWTFGDGATSTLQNPSHTYTAAGSYTVALTATGPGGNDTLTRTNYVTVNPPAPVAGFSGTPLSGSTPLAVNFSDSSTGSITSRLWTFGDGATSTLQNPSHTYTAAGSYTVALTVTGPGGNDTLTRTNYITAGEPAPVANFSGSPLSGSAPLLVGFNDSSSGAITSWSWTFGDGASSTLQNPSHTYTLSGSYTVALTVTGPGGNDTETRVNYVNVSSVSAPVANFTGTPLAGTAPLLVSFSDSSTGSITSRLWTFGDGATSTLQNPSHTYTAAGSYTVALTVTGPGGNDTLTRTNYISATPASGGPVYYVSVDSNAVIPGVAGTTADEDVVAYDSATGTWSMYFDGSDVGIAATDIDSLHVRADGSILMGFNGSLNVIPGLTGGPAGNDVDDSDIVLFTPTSTGVNTAGSFSFYFDGSDVGLTTSSEDIDGLYEFPDGRLLISTLGSASANGISGVQDEDALIFTGSYGSVTSGSFSAHFDGSDVGFSLSSSYDLDALHIAGSNMLFSTTGTYAAAGGAGDSEDISSFSGNFGLNTTGTATLLYDFSSLGLPSIENVNGFSQLP